MRVALVLLFAVVLAACESEPDARPADSRPPGSAPLVGCGQRAEGPPGVPEVSAGRDWVAGPVVLFAFRDYARLARKRPERVARNYERGWGAVKILAGVRAGSDVRVEVAPASRDLTALVYSTPRDPRNAVDRLHEGRRAIVFRPCPEDHPRWDDRGTVGDRTDFAGGFLVAKAGCLRLLVTAGAGPARRYELPYGRSC